MVTDTGPILTVSTSADCKPLVSDLLQHLLNTSIIETKAPKNSEVARRGMACGVLPKIHRQQQTHVIPIGGGPRGRADLREERRNHASNIGQPMVIEEEARVAVVGGYIAIPGAIITTVATVDIFSLITRKQNGQIISETGTWKEGKIRSATLSLLSWEFELITANYIHNEARWLRKFVLEDCV